jgi:hypothetical protein
MVGDLAIQTSNLWIGVLEEEKKAKKKIPASISRTDGERDILED